MEEKESEFMRIIKFRGKQINETWAYGDLLKIGSGAIIYHGDAKEYDVSKDEDIAIGLYENEISVVYPDTISQFTGQYDRKGRYVYEGDIVLINRRGDGYIGKVVFTNAAFGVNTHYDGMFYAGDYDEIEVIGNVFDNPELLKGAEK